MKRRIAAVAATGAIAALLLSGCSLIPQPTLPQQEPSGQNAESFGEQQPRWQDCGDGFECAEVYAPLDWADPAGENITLSLAKHPATSGEPIGTLFINPGGPGASAVEYAMGSIDNAVQPEVQEYYDVIAWDPRGVGASSPVSCVDAEQMDEFLFGAGAAEGLEVGSDEWIEASIAEVTEFGEACAERTGPLLGHVSTDDTVQDLEMLRAIVGDDKLNYLGYSYGTYIGARYADAYPERVGRLVLDGAMDPTSTLADVVREQTLGFEQALKAYVTDCLSRSDCPLTGSVESAMQQIGTLLDDVDARPLKGEDGRTFTSGTFLTAIITPLYSQDSWPYLDMLFAEVAAGDAETGLMLADFYYDREGGEYLNNMTEAFTAINCLDYPREFDRQRMDAEAAELNEIAPTIGRFQGYGDVSCAGWPHEGVKKLEGVTAAGADPILVIGTTGDPATPYRWAESLADQLESGTLVTYEGEGHTAYGDNSCVNGIVDDYLLTGAVPNADPRCS